MNLKTASKKDETINSLVRMLWFVLHDANTELDYECRELIVHDLADATGFSFDELWQLQGNIEFF